jgi:hypothetical protein
MHCARRPERRIVSLMMFRRYLNSQRFSPLRLLRVAAMFFGACGSLIAQPPPAALAAFDTYVSAVEARLAQQHQSHDAFLAPVDAAPTPASEAQLLRGEAILQKIAPAATTPLAGAMLHHWRGTAFVPGATAADFGRLLRDFPGYPKYFAPQVVRASILTHAGDTLQGSMRVKQKHVLTVVMDTAYDIRFGQLDPQHAYSLSRSTRIAEIDAAGTAHEHTLGPEDEHGFLWRLNTYWSYEERDRGLYVQIESVSLTRSIPTGLGWVVRPYVESVPRESLEFTLRAVCSALKK